MLLIWHVLLDECVSCELTMEFVYTKRVVTK
jgi:hypothetical protein